MRHSHVFNFCLLFFKLGQFVLQLMPLYGIATKHYWLKCLKFCFYDIITAFLLFSNAAHSCIQFLFNFFQTWSIFSSTHAFVWDCNPAFSANIFYTIWPPKITETPLNTEFEKRKNKTMISVDWDPLMSNMTVFRLSFKLFAVKIKEIVDIFTFRCHLFHTLGFGYCG